MEPKGSPNRISVVRKEAGITQSELAERIGTSAQQIHKLEVGSRRLTVEWLLKISDGLECHPADLLPVTHQTMRRRADTDTDSAETTDSRDRLREKVKRVTRIVLTKSKEISPPISNEQIAEMIAYFTADGRDWDLDVMESSLREHVDTAAAIAQIRRVK